MLRNISTRFPDYDYFMIRPRMDDGVIPKFFFGIQFGTRKGIRKAAYAGTKHFQRRWQS